MKNTEISPIQEQIAKALLSLKERAKFTEAILAKRLRETAKIDQKKKACIALNDLEKAIDFVAENESVFFNLTVTAANDLLIEKSDEAKPLSLESRQRRQKSEKSMSIFTNGDLKQSKNKPEKHQNKRTERKSLNINGCLEDWEK